MADLPGRVYYQRFDRAPTRFKSLNSSQHVWQAVEGVGEK